MHIDLWLKWKTIRAVNIIKLAQMANQGFPADRFFAQGTGVHPSRNWTWTVWSTGKHVLHRDSGNSVLRTGRRKNTRNLRAFIGATLRKFAMVCNQSCFGQECGMAGLTSKQWSWLWCSGRISKLEVRGMWCKVSEDPGVGWGGSWPPVSTASESGFQGRIMVGMIGKCDASYVWPNNVLICSSTPHWCWRMSLLFCSLKMRCHDRYPGLLNHKQYPCGPLRKQEDPDVVHHNACESIEPEVPDGSRHSGAPAHWSTACPGANTVWICCGDAFSKKVWQQ